MPTETEVKAAYAAFTDVADAAITPVLALVVEMVKADLPSQVIFTQAATLYVCHELTMRGHGVSAEAEMARTGTQGIASASDGSSSFTRAQPGAADNPLMQTTYGIQYMALIRQYVLPVFACTGDHE